MRDEVGVGFVRSHVLWEGGGGMGQGGFRRFGNR